MASVNLVVSAALVVVPEPAAERPRLLVPRWLLCYSVSSSLLPAQLQMQSAWTEAFAAHVLLRSVVVNRVKSVGSGHSMRNLS